MAWFPCCDVVCGCAGTPNTLYMSIEASAPFGALDGMVIEMTRQVPPPSGWSAYWISDYFSACGFTDWLAIYGQLSGGQCVISAASEFSSSFTPSVQTITCGPLSAVQTGTFSTGSGPCTGNGSGTLTVTP